MLNHEYLPRAQQLVREDEAAEGVPRGPTAVADDVRVAEREAEGAEGVDARVHAGHDGVVFGGGGGGEGVGDA